MTINNYAITNIYVTGDLAFLVIMLGKEHKYPKWCIKCTLHPKVWSEYGHINGDNWTIDALRLMYQLDLSES